jgi:hypothetical protein
MPLWMKKGRRGAPSSLLRLTPYSDTDTTAPAQTISSSATTDAVTVRMADSIKVCMVGLLYLFSATVPPAAQSGNKCEMSFMRR